MSKTKKKRSYTEEFKASVLQKLEEPNNTITSLSDELGVPRPTIYQWIKKAEADNMKVSINHKVTSKWTSEDKFHVVLETSTFSETELAEYCRRKGIYVDEVKMWRNQCLKANEEAKEDPKELKESLKAEKDLNKELERELRPKDKALAETAALLVLRKKANAIWGDPRGRMISDSDRVTAVMLINEARENGARLKPACDELNISERTYQRWTAQGISEDKIKKDQRPLIERPTPKNKLTEAERKEIIKVVNNPEYADLAPSQIVPKLADEGKYLASESTIYKILREEKMNAHRGRTSPLVKREPPTHIATAPNEVWTWDITWLNGFIKGQFYKLYLIIDMFSRLIVAYEVWEEEKAEHAEYLIRKATLSQGTAGKPLVLYSDNGSPMKAATFQATLEKLGVQSSFSRPRVSNDNPYSEALFKTMKYRPKCPFKGFRGLEEARIWVEKFVNWYNKIHLHSGIKFITPYQRHYGLDKEIMRKRQQTYEKAKAKHPERWSKGIRDWTLPEYVSLNPIDEEEANGLLHRSN